MDADLGFGSSCNGFERSGACRNVAGPFRAGFTSVEGTGMAESVPREVGIGGASGSTRGLVGWPSMVTMEALLFRCL